MNALPAGWDISVALDRDLPRILLIGPDGDGACFHVAPDSVRAEVVRLFAEACTADSASDAPCVINGCTNVAKGRGLFCGEHE